tara:strand:- start:672 stop:1028 length:357 start_codon:yes stop_codon:yes gene_type:complete
MTFLKNNIIALLLLVSYNLQAQQVITNLKKTQNGIVVLQINADFNKSNTLDLNNLSDCKVFYMDISDASSLKISKVPTIIIFDGKEQVRFEANIMMKLDATRKDVQNFVDNLILNKFN